MGIKGIYAEIGPGKRIALAKLAVEHYEQTNLPLRIAIDISIWQFQIQSGQGGSNPAIRTLYYRLVRLLGYQIQPLFIFDGPHKPPFKRNKKTGNGTMAPNFLTKQLLKLFGFPFYAAPGEAEAECALLQREGIVDAVLSEDVDTLMFGCELTLRNWSSEGARNKTPTHISAYYATETKEGKSGLDREGMILVALMSGGDYVTEGIPGCGPKIACEAARAGFGKSLCRISRSDAVALEEWRRTLAYEIQTNESKYFRSRHNALKIPEDFPNKDVLGYYTHPVVSSAPKIERLREGIEWDNEVDVQGLRQFVAEAFDWTGKIGATKYIRTIASALLSQKLRLRGARRASGHGDLILTAMNEMELVREICGKRTHISSDGIPELRVVYHPLDIVRLNLEDEPDDSADYGRNGLAPVLDDDQIEAYQSDDNGKPRSESPIKRAASQYDPSQPDKEWIPETIVRLGVPLKLEDYEESQRNPGKFLKQRAAAKKAGSKKGAKSVAQQGAMEKFVTISKARPKEKELSGSSKLRQSPFHEGLPPMFSAPCLDDVSDDEDPEFPSFTRKSTRNTASTEVPAASKAQTRKKKTIQAKPPPSSIPWGIASQVGGSFVTKPLNARPPKSKSPPPARFRKSAFSIDLTSSSPSLKEPEQFTFIPKKHVHSPELSESDSELPLSLPNVRTGSPLNTPPTSKDRNPLRPSPRKRSSLGSEKLAYTPKRNVSESPNSAKTQELDIRDILKIPGVGLRRGRARGRSIKSMAQKRHSSPELPTIDRFFKTLSGPKKTKKKKENQVITLSSSPPVLSPLLPSTRHQEFQENTPVVSESIIRSSSPTSMPPPPRPSFAKATPQELLEDSQFSPEAPIISKTSAAATKKKFIIARDSMPGGWKPIGEQELEELEKKDKVQRNGKTRRAWRMSQVEVLDLTND